MASRRSRHVRDPVLDMVFQAASDDNLPLFKALVTVLDMGRGRPKEAIEALRVEEAGKLQGFSALHIAATRGSLRVCRYLVEELLVDVDLVDKEGRTPLLFATYHSGGTAEYLLDHGAGQDEANNDGVSLLHYAAESGNCEMLELLLAKGAYVDPVAPHGTPLQGAAGEGQYGAVKILLDHNADYNKMVNGVTPLMAARDANSTECIKLLVKVQEEPMLKREIVASELISLGSISLKKKDYAVAAKLYSRTGAFVGFTWAMEERLC